MTTDKVTGREIILMIGKNMLEGLEPLVTKTLAPSLYQVYLHAEDYERLERILPEIEADAKLFLDLELEKLERSAVRLGNRVLRKFRSDNASRLAHLPDCDGHAIAMIARTSGDESRWFRGIDRDVQLRAC